MGGANLAHLHKRDSDIESWNVSLINKTRSISTTSLLFTVPRRVLWPFL